MIPPPLRGKGDHGKDIGAEVLLRYKDGIVTQEPLWPWPMEDRILNETGISVTYERYGGLWKNLPDIEGVVSTPDEIRIEQ